MRRKEKIWGWTTELFRNNTTSTHYLEIKKGGYCSEHRHAQKVNLFFIISGTLEITTWSIDDDDYTWVRECTGSYVIPVGTWHRFRALTVVKCIEIYDYKYDGVDIERRTVGGIEDIKTD